MIHEFIVRQLEHRYRVLERALRNGLTEELAWRPLGGRPPIGWHACHIAEAIASTAEAIALGPGSMELVPEVQKGAIRRGSSPSPEAASYEEPGVQGLITELNRLSLKLLIALKSLTDADLEKPPLVEVHAAFRSTLVSRMVFLEGHLFHVSYHLGAIGLLRAEWHLEP
ncbi:MAG: hypothetical protein ACJA0P_002948 [Planctomycetota bacterium]|jgi:hypothetical protein